MNIAYLIGNGFDRNLGLKTGYRDFYKYYKQQDSANEAIAKFKEKIDIDSECWADLEIALGERTADYSEWGAFENVYFDVNFQLKKYLEGQEQKLEVSPEFQEKMFRDIVFPETYFNEATRLKIQEYRSNWRNTTPWNVDIITYNYTSSMERLLDLNKEKGRTLVSNKYGNPVKLRNIYHIHGVLSDEILVGVNDISQIKNETFRDNPDAVEILVKPKTNEMFDTLITRRCQNVIENSNLICLFGLSIGDTDKMWWKYIGNRLFGGNGPAKMIIFHKGDEVSRFKSGVIRRERQQHFLEQAGWTKADASTVADKIFVAYNTDCFKIMQKSQ